PARPSPLSLHDALPISTGLPAEQLGPERVGDGGHRPRRLLDHQTPVQPADPPDEPQPSRLTQLVHDRTAITRVIPHPRPLGTRRSEEHTSELQSRENLV